MSSLQDQLLKAGLTTKDKVVKAKSAKRKQQKTNRKHKLNQQDEAKLAAEKALAEKAEKDRLLNQAINSEAEQKALIAQVRQLIESNQQDFGKPAVEFKFSDAGAIKSISVSNEIHRHLTQGLLAVAKNTDGYALVPAAIAQKINERAEDFVIMLNDKTTEQLDEDDPYAEFQVPDDLMW